MGIFDKAKAALQQKPCMKVCMMGPRAVGKTTVLTAVFNETKDSIISTKLKLTDRGDTGALLDDRYKQLRAVFREHGDISSVGRPAAGIAATANEHEFFFSFGMLGKDPSIDLEIKDFPGEYVEREPELVKQFIKDSTAIFIAIDTPHLIEDDGAYCEVKNKISSITNFFREALASINGEKLVLLIPLKCEKYMHEKRMGEVLERVEERYAELISLFRGHGRICCAVTPILTLGGVEFEDFNRDGAGTVMLGVEGTPERVKYRYTDEGKYEPRFCQQPLYSTLSFVAAQYSREKIRTDWLGRLKNMLWQVFSNDTAFFDEVLTMEGNRISDTPSLGYKVLCGGEFFHYNH